MAKQRYINTKFWDDSYIMDLDPIEKLLFLYFLTNPLTHISGIYEIQLKRIAFDTGIDKDMILKIIERFSRAGKIHYYSNYIFIVNFIFHQNVNPKIDEGIKKSLKELPDVIKSILEIDYDRLSIGYDRLLKALNYTKPNTNTKSKAKEKKAFVKPTIEEIKEYCKERNNSILPTAFYDFYESKNWMIGKNKMKDWKACVRTWEQRSVNQKAQGDNGSQYEEL